MSKQIDVYNEEGKIVADIYHIKYINNGQLIHSVISASDMPELLENIRNEEGFEKILSIVEDVNEAIEIEDEEIFLSSPKDYLVVGRYESHTEIKSFMQNYVTHAELSKTIRRKNAVELRIAPMYRIKRYEDESYIVYIHIGHGQYDSAKHVAWEHQNAGYIFKICVYKRVKDE